MQVYNAYVQCKSTCTCKMYEHKKYSFRYSMSSTVFIKQMPPLPTKLDFAYVICNMYMYSTLATYKTAYMYSTCTCNFTQHTCTCMYNLTTTIIIIIKKTTLYSVNKYDFLFLQCTCTLITCPNDPFPMISFISYR